MPDQSEAVLDGSLVPSVPGINPISSEDGVQSRRLSGASIQKARIIPLSGDKSETEETTTKVASEYPGDDNAFQAWVIVAAAFMIQFFSIGQRDAFGVLQRFFVADHTFPGSTNLQISLIGALAASVLMAFGPVAGFMVGRFGLSPTVMMGGICICAGQVFASFAYELWQAHLSLGVLVGVGFAFSYFS
ncbi:hypothetical protein HDU93_008025, partial [Gonapodya sp. JEL0774]